MTAIDPRLFSFALSGLRPPARPSTAEWAETNLVLSAEIAARPGLIRLTTLQRQILDAIDDPSVQVVVLQLSAQQGKSTVLLAALLRILACDPGPILHVSPTAEKARDWSRTTLEPLLVSNPDIRALIGRDANGEKSKAGNAGDSAMFRSFPGGSLSLASSFKAEDLAARAIRYLFMDEVDRFAISAGKEGNPIALAWKRTKTYNNRKIIIASTPTSAGTSRINALYKRGTMERFNVPCPECGVFFAPALENLVWKEGDPRSAKIACPECGHHMTERERVRALPKGMFVATNSAPEEGIRSFHASEIVSSFSTLREVVAAAEAAKDPVEKRAFVNTTLAEVFDAGSEAERDPVELRSRAVPVSLPLPRDVLFLTAGVDVQGNRLEMTILAHAPTRRIVVDHLVLGGDPTGHEVWDLLFREISRTYEAERGRHLPIAATFVDSGYLATQVRSFAVKHPRVHAIIGRGRFDRPALARGQRIEGTPRHVLIVGVDNQKLVVAKGLKIPATEPGHIVLPDHLDEDYFTQLSNEKLTERVVRGYPVQKWVLENGRAEAFDCLVYALTAATLVRNPPKSASSEKTQTIGELAAALQRDGQVTERASNIMRLN